VEAPAGHDGPPLLARLRNAVGFERPPPAPGGRRRASVLLVFDPSRPSLPLLFILRSASLRSHAGQIAFPGGSSEPGDRDPVATALREAREEVALAPSNVDILGTLPPLLTAVSDLWLTPVVGLQREPWTIVVDEIEVAEWFRVDLDTLLSTPHTVRTMSRNGETRAVHFYETSGRVIWGVSAAILHELMQRLGRED